MPVVSEVTMTPMASAEAENTAIIAEIGKLLGRVPVFGICLGHQLISLAYGAETYKLKFGHRGGNHPVMNLTTGKVEMTSQNHSYAVREESLANTGLEVTHVNILDGTVDMIATDHAPHSAQEKARGLAGSAMGIVGLETAFPLLYKYLVLKGVITLEKLIALMSANPRRIFALEGGVEEGDAADFTVLDLGAEYAVDPGTFLSKGRATPFAGWKVQGRAVLTVVGGKEVYDDNYESNR